MDLQNNFNHRWFNFLNSSWKGSICLEVKANYSFVLRLVKDVFNNVRHFSWVEHMHQKSTNLCLLLVQEIWTTCCCVLIIPNVLGSQIARALSFIWCKQCKCECIYKGSQQITLNQVCCAFCHEQCDHHKHPVALSDLWFLSYVVYPDCLAPQDLY